MFRVKAVYDYASPHEDDLSFKAGQIITVTEEEGDDWYVGEYLDEAGNKHDGLFPTNFVEKYEPAPPPRPNRASRARPPEPPQAQAAAPVPEPEPAPVPVHEPAPASAPVQHYEPDEPEPQPEPRHEPEPPAPAVKPDPSPISPPPITSASARQPEAAKPPPAAKKAPPPVAAKSNAFRDRIAAFNAPAAAPIQPFKPPGASTTFIKKPFVAPPPSRNAYVPPPVRDTPQARPYRRDEDPEIAERQAQDQVAAERAGLVAHDSAATNEGEQEDLPKPTSLKERIALLQKQQQEQAERAAAAIHKEKPKRPPVKKRAESHDGQADDSEDTGLDRIGSASSRDRTSLDHARPPRPPHDLKSPDSHHRNRDFHSDANDADQSGAGETEDAEGESTSIEDDEDRTRTRQAPPLLRAPTAPTKEPDVGDEQDVDQGEEEEEEDEMDAETRRKLELRERMAKMSGGMGMPGMFVGMPIGALPPKKKKPGEKKAEEENEYASPQQRVPMFPMPGMPGIPSKGTDQERKPSVVESEGGMSHPITGSHAPNDVPDMEDITHQPVQRTPTGEQPPPIPTDSKFLVARKPIRVLARQTGHCSKLSCSNTVSKSYTTYDEASEYVMTVSVSSMFGVDLSRLFVYLVAQF